MTPAPHAMSAPSTTATDRMTAAGATGARTTSATATAGTETLTVGGVTFGLRRSARRRTIAITIPRQGPPVVALPLRCSRRRAEAAVTGKLAWVRRKLGERAALAELPPHRYEAGERFPYLGREHELVVVGGRPRPGAAGGSAVGERGGQLAFDVAALEAGAGGLVAGAGGGPDDGASVPLRLHEGRFELLAAAHAEAAEHFRAWYRRRAADVLNARVAHFTPLVGVAPPHVTVKDMRSRWGSCSAKGRVSLHWGLVLLAPALLDYVVVHELCHLRELNHQPAFWRRVEAVLPDWRERRKRLRVEGARSVV